MLGEIFTAWVVVVGDDYCSTSRLSWSLVTCFVIELDALLMPLSPLGVLAGRVGTDGGRVVWIREGMLFTGASSIELLDSGVKSQ